VDAEAASNAPPLIVRFAAFGDVVLITTMIEVLYRRYGTPVDLLSSGSWTRAILADDPRVRHIQLVTSRKTPYPLRPSQWQAVRWMRRRGRGAVYQCDPEPKAQWLVEHAGVPRDWIVRAHDFPAPQPMHWTEWWFAIGMRTPPALAGKVPVPDAADIDAVPRLYVGAAARADCQQWLAARGWQSDPLVLIQAGNKRTLKRGRMAGAGDNKYWPPQRWAELARGVLRQQPTARVLLTGAPVEHAVVEAIRLAAGSPRVHNLATDMTVPRLLALLERAHSMISVDTGPAHAAAALDCPLTVLFANADQRWWRPRSRLGHVAVLGGAAGPDSRLIDIEVPAVLAAWSALGGRGGSWAAPQLIA
jgi:heptosyltransferase-2/heptosyltransferase-3